MKMSLKIIWLLVIFALATMVLAAEARGGRGRGGSFGTTFYRRSHKKHSSSSGTSSRRKVVSGSPVHTSYTKALISGGHNTDLKLGSSHKSFSSHSSSSSSHNRHPYRDASHTNYHSFSQFYTQPRSSRYGSSATNHYNTLGANAHISHTWGGHQLPPGHVYVAQPARMPPNSVYYAQPPRYRSSADDATDFVLGYLVGRSLTHRNHHQHYYQHYQEQQPTNGQTINTKVNLENNTATTSHSVTNKNNNNTTNQTHYWPTDFAVSLAPLNESLLAEDITSSPREAIFKSPPIHIARSLKVDNLTFELPTATAAPPDMPPTGGIICMPWLFNETDPIHPANVVTIEKTICFPAPSPPPPSAPQTTPQSSTDPIAGDIAVRILQ
ncbi:uncharacterized protein LOC118740565 [Rhagoletis pomonella]|uniref:uncharacterized protein LOC118740565 n=1 Tax=Rhagoletis pomonella TaxID=28610 RepID=UPI00177D6575|nr:uncharacterized protein LOC118740565 [Rhagoletis pomonella]